MNLTGTHVPFRMGRASDDLRPTCTRPKLSDGTSMDSEGPCVLCCGIGVNMYVHTYIRVCMLGCIWHVYCMCIDKK